MPNYYEWLLEKYEICDMLVENIYNYLENMRSVVSEEVDNYIIDGDAHSVHLKSRLHFLFTVLSLSEQKLSKTQVDSLWVSLVDNAISDNSRDSAYEWFSICIDSHETILNKEEVVYIFTKMLDTSITDGNVQYLIKFFENANVLEGRIKLIGGHMHIDSFDLLGIEKLWDVSFSSTKLVLTC